jgi:hypothetical protein
MYEPYSSNWYAYRDGYDQGNEFHMGSGSYPEMPDGYTEEEEIAWKHGVEDAGDDS